MTVPDSWFTVTYGSENFVGKTEDEIREGLRDFSNYTINGEDHVSAFVLAPGGSAVASIFVHNAYRKNLEARAQELAHSLDAFVFGRFGVKQAKPSEVKVAPPLNRMGRNDAIRAALAVDSFDNGFGKGTRIFKEEGGPDETPLPPA